MPAISTICRSAPLRQIHPDFNQSIIDRLKIISDNLSDEAKEAVLLFDAIHIRPDLRYNQHLDEVMGFFDLGNLGKQAEIGK